MGPHRLDRLDAVPDVDGAGTLKVELSSWEWWLGAQAATRRQLDALTHGYNLTKNVNNKESEALWWHVLGALGEIAVAKGLGLFWNGASGTFKDADLGTEIQVRTSQFYRGLRIRPNDKDGHFYIAVLADGYPFNYELLGWMKGEDAKQDRWYKPADGRGGESWFVESLHPMDKFPLLKELVT